MDKKQRVEVDVKASPAGWVDQAGEEISVASARGLGLTFGGMYMGLVDAGVLPEEAAFVVAEAFTQMVRGAHRKADGDIR